MPGATRKGNAWRGKARNQKIFNLDPTGRVGARLDSVMRSELRQC